MSFTVQGYIDGVSYAVAVGIDPETTVDALGVVAGSPAALDVLASWDGRSVEMSPVGPFITGSTTDPRGVLAVLTAITEVTSVVGDDVPDLLGAVSAGEH